MTPAERLVTRVDRPFSGAHECIWLDEVHERHMPDMHKLREDQFVYHCDCAPCELCELVELREGAKPRSGLLDAAERLGKARKAWAESFGAYVFVHNGNTYLAKAAADEEWAESLVKAEALYEIAKAKLHGGTDADRV